jgi:hypothetical protein
MAPKAVPEALLFPEALLLYTHTLLSSLSPNNKLKFRRNSSPHDTARPPIRLAQGVEM